MNKCIIIVPIYKEKLNYDEEQSVKRLFKILGNHYICAICPQSLDLSYYESKFNFNDFYYFYDEYFKSVATYSKLMLNYGFYEYFKEFEYMLIYQTDAWVFSDQLDYWCDQGYDYIGAPHYYVNYEWVDNGNCGNGGFSLRKISWFIETLKKHKDHIDSIKDKDYPEDFYLRDYCRHEGNFAPMVECAKFAFELQPHILYQIIDCKKPFGCHAYKTVVDKGFYEMYNWIEYED